MRRLQAPAIAAISALIACAALYASAPGAQAADPNLVIDAGIEGNAATIAGPVAENCISVKKGAVFQMDIVAHDISDLLAWEIYIEFDKSIVQITDQDVKLFLQSTAGSSVLDVSGRVPDDTGLHQFSAVDSSDDPKSADSGSGVLARMTFEAIGSGDSKISFASRDEDGNGKLDKGILLRDSDTNAIGDTNNDNNFDGPRTDAEVAVDQDCPAGAIVAASPPEPPGEGSDFPWAIAGGGAAAAVIIVGGLGALVMRRRRKVTPAAPATPDEPVS